MLPNILRSVIDRLDLTNRRPIRRLDDVPTPPVADTLVLSLAAVLWVVLLAGWLPDLGPAPAGLAAPMHAPGVPEAIAAANGFSGAAAYLLMWGTMMLAMMLPSLLPVVRRIHEQVCPSAAVSAPSIAAFLGAYGLVWTLAGTIPLAIAHVASIRGALTGSVLGFDVGVLAVGGLLAFAGAYQFSRPKRELLSQCARCRSIPHRPTVPRMAREGLRYAVNCVGCTWPLFAAMVALGTMNAAVMVVVTFVVVFERIAPASRDVAAAWGVLLFGAAALTLGGGVPIW